MMRLIDADALKKSILNSLGINSEAYLIFGSDKKIWKLINDAPTIQPDTDTVSRQAALDAVLNLNVENRVSWRDAVIDTIDALPHSPSRWEGKWLASDDMYETGICSCCRWDSQEPFDYAIANFHFCPNCGADMRTPVEIARNIVHKVIDNSVWADSVDTAKMHKVVDDKYAEIRGDANVDAES